MRLRGRFLFISSFFCCLYNRPHHLPPSLAHVKDGGEGFFSPRLFLSHAFSSHSQVPAASHSIGGAALRDKKKGSYGQPCLTRERPRSCLVSMILGPGKRGKEGNLKWDDGRKGVSATHPGKPSGDSGFSLSPPL